ncbi:BZ3500_MvSof-1268-A1-R1_Chr2-2g04822 [Microbotryum saponariae]|uniref:BZ3500_MvSof-1268-A1-R1_Chr2-2g04822 protein n=1 Tax=Microbotryum saponariae TaxID=289078 RepID=A0A2X0LUU8_9BASI|nr:BZ3500_MvSof-1268-A1-R1_Chr2-2g04822 [Microbotryum saponariae]SDA00255.1 BZ3501_MvSof-1269-A2-R1_Chr2-2g04496 [Microbotryum saponariae]
MSSSGGVIKVLKNITKTKASALPPCTCTCSALGSRLARLDHRLPSSVTPLGSNASSVRHYSLSGSDTPTSSNSKESSPPPNRKSRSTVLAYLALPSLLGAFAFQHFSPTDDSKRPLSPDYFIPLKINKVTRLNHDNTLIGLDLPDSLSPRQYIAAQGSRGDEDPWRIHSIFVKQPELQIQRPYTPLNISFLNPLPSESSPSTTIQLLIKRYDDGEVSRYLHRLGPGDQVQIRGPMLTADLPKVDRIVFIAGGTGITPAHQIITSFLRHPTANPPSISILYAAQEPVLASSLEQLEKDANFPVDLKVFSEMTSSSRITEQVLQKELGRAKDGGENCLVVVCGPESMITDLAGPRARDLSPGPIGGVLGKLGYTSSQVLKL